MKRTELMGQIKNWDDFKQRRVTVISNYTKAIKLSRRMHELAKQAVLCKFVKKLVKSFEDKKRAVKEHRAAMHMSILLAL